MLPNTGVQTVALMRPAPHDARAVIGLPGTLATDETAVTRGDDRPRHVLGKAVVNVTHRQNLDVNQLSTEHVASTTDTARTRCFGARGRDRYTEF